MPSSLLLLLLSPPAPIAFPPRRRSRTISGPNRSSDGIASPTTLRLPSMLLLPCSTLNVSLRLAGDVAVPVTLPLSWPTTLLALGGLARPARWSPCQTPALATRTRTAPSVLRCFLVAPVAALLGTPAVASAPSADVVVVAAIASARVGRRRRADGLRALPTPFAELYLPFIGASWAPGSSPAVPAAVLEPMKTGRRTSTGSDGGRHQSKV